MRKHDLSRLRISSSPASPSTSRPPRGSPRRSATGVDNYWQTESGWPILTVANGIAPMKSKYGSPGVRDVRLRRPPGRRGDRRRHRRAGPEGRRRDRRADAAGLHAARLARRPRFVNTYWSSSPAAALRHLRLGHPDAEGYWLSSAAPTTSSMSPATAWARAKSRGHSSHAGVAEVAVVGVAVGGVGRQHPSAQGTLFVCARHGFPARPRKGPEKEFTRSTGSAAAPCGSASISPANTPISPTNLRLLDIPNPLCS